MVIIKKTCFVFLFFLVSLYCLIIGIFGSGGLFYNNSLKKIIEIMETKEEKLIADIENLKSYSEKIFSEEKLRDEAVNFGYAVEGDYVYLFSSSDIQEPYKVYDLSDVNIVPYNALSRVVCFCIAFGVSLLISFFYFLVKRNSAIKDQNLDF